MLVQRERAGEKHDSPPLSPVCLAPVPPSRCRPKALMTVSPSHAIERHIVSQLLSPAARAQYHTGDVSHAELRPVVAEIERISAAYTGHSVGATIAQPVSSQQAAEAYALYYTAINAAKIAHLAPLVTSEKKCLRVLDFGSGPGTASLALLAALPHDLSLHCIESSPGMRSVAERLLLSWQGPSRVSSLSFSSSITEALRDEPFDLVVAANSLAELSEDAAAQLMQQLSSLVAPEGFLMLVEPGQPQHTRRLMKVRDSLCSAFTPIFPCTRRDPCPMLAASEADWCHGTLTWAQPPLSCQLDSLLGFNKHRIKYSAFVFQRGGSLRPGVRVIAAAERSKRGTEVLVCGESFYGVTRIRKGARSEGTRALEKALAFERVELSAPAQPELPEGVNSSRSVL